MYRQEGHGENEGGKGRVLQDHTEDRRCCTRNTSLDELRLPRDRLHPFAPAHESTCTHTDTHAQTN